MTVHYDHDPIEPSAADVERAVAALRAARPDAWISADGQVRVSEADAALVLGVSERALRRWRADGTAPPFVHVRKVTYRVEDLVGWILARRYAA